MLGKTLERIKTALGRVPWDRELRQVYADCLEELGQDEAAQQQRKLAEKKTKRPAKARSPEHQETARTTDSNTVFRKLCTYEMNFTSRCSICGPKSGCNARRRPGHTSWKKSRKQRWRAK